MRLLVVRLSSMGDVIHTLPAITDAVNNNHDLKIDWVVEKDFAEIPAWHHAVDNVWPIEQRSLKKYNIYTRTKKLYQQLQEARSQKYDLIIDSQGLLKSLLVARMCKGKVAGLSTDSAKEPLAAIGYNYKYKVSKQEHAILRNRSLFAKALGYKINNMPSTIDYGLGDFDFVREETPRPYIVLLHGTTWSSKHWPYRKWAEFAEIADVNGFDVSVSYYNDVQKERVEYLQQRCTNIVSVGKQSITEAAKRIYNASGVVTVDTGLGHLAAALKTPIVSLYGATSTKLTGVLAPITQALAFTSSRHCSPCLNKFCQYRNNKDELGGLCMDDHAPEDVWKSLLRLMQK